MGILWIFCTSLSWGASKASISDTLSLGSSSYVENRLSGVFPTSASTELEGALVLEKVSTDETAHEIELGIAHDLDDENRLRASLSFTGGPGDERASSLNGEYAHDFGKALGRDLRTEATLKLGGTRLSDAPGLRANAQTQGLVGLDLSHEFTESMELTAGVAHASKAQKRFLKIQAPAASDLPTVLPEWSVFTSANWALTTQDLLLLNLTAQRYEGDSHWSATPGLEYSRDLTRGFQLTAGASVTGKAASHPFWLGSLGARVRI